MQVFRRVFKINLFDLFDIKNTPIKNGLLGGHWGEPGLVTQR